MQIQYRRLKETELETYIAIRVKQLREEGAAQTADLTPALRDYYGRHLADGTFVCFLALDGERIVGAGCMSFVERPPFYGCPNGRLGILSGMYTAPDCRRMGIARELLRRAVNEAAEHGCGLVQVTGSDAGVRLYEACGFRHNDNYMYYPLSGGKNARE